MTLGFVIGKALGAVVHQHCSYSINRAGFGGISAPLNLQFFCHAERASALRDFKILNRFAIIK